MGTLTAETVTYKVTTKFEYVRSFLFAVILFSPPYSSSSQFGPEAISGRHLNFDQNHSGFTALLRKGPDS